MAPEALLEADFQVLGLEPGSTPSEVRQAYRGLVKKWHPDRHHSKPYETRAFAENKFREIDEAYKRISGSWKQTPHLSGGREGRHEGRRAAGMTTGAPKTSAHTALAIWNRAKIVIRPFLRPRIVLPVLLLLIGAAFMFTHLLSFFPVASIDSERSKDNHQSQDPGLNTAGADPSGLKGFSSDDRPPATDHRSRDVPQSPLPGLNTSGAGPGDPNKLFSDDWPLTTDHRFNSPPALLQPKPTETPGTFFSLGSTTSDVLDIQGTPSRIQGQTWTYGLSEVQFINGRVSRFNNFDGSLRVRMQPGVPGNHDLSDHITIGSSENEVLLVQGTPTKVEGNRWYYGFAELVFKNGRLAEYDNYFGTLKMRVLPSGTSGPRPPGSSFAVGSTPDEVLAAQGTPTAIHGNRWSFDFAFVFFRDGRVHSATNTDGKLHFIAPGEER